MGLKIFHIKLSDISKINNLLLTTRIKQYNKDYNDKDLILSYFLDLKNKFTLGQLQKEDYQINGSYPIVDQSKDLIIGYTNQKDLVYTGILPIIVFGDHTRNFKYIDFPFVQGADGIKILTPDYTKVNSKFFYYLLKTISVPSRGYNRHYSILKKQKYPNINLNLQNKVIKQIEPLENDIQNLKLQKKEYLEIINDVFSEEYNYPKTLWKEFGKGMTAGTQKSDDKSLVTYTLKLSQIRKSNIFRISSRFHNSITQKLNDILNSKESIFLNKIINYYEKGIQPKYSDNGDVDIIKIWNMKNNYIDFNNSEKIDYSLFNNLRETKKIKQNDLIICCTGKVSLGKIDILEDDINAITTVDNYNININQTLYNPLFLTYFLRSILGTYQIERDYTGTTNQIHLYWNEIGSFIIPNFTLEHQQQLVDEIKTKIDSQKDIDKQIKQKQDEISKIIEDCIHA